MLLVDFRRPMRWPGRLLNAAFLAAFKQTAYVKEARKRFAEWEQGFYEAGAQGR